MKMNFMLKPGFLYYVTEFSSVGAFVCLGMFLRTETEKTYTLSSFLTLPGNIVYFITRRRDVQNFLVEIKEAI